MSNDINSQLDKEVHKEWRKRIEDDSEVKDKHFTADGILYNNLSEKELSHAWRSSPIRVLFLLKEQNQKDKGTGKWDEDIRQWLTGDSQQCKDNAELKNSFMQYFAYLLWGFSKIDKDNDCWLEEVTKHIDEVKKFFLTQPFAIVECKKTPGGGKSDAADIKYHLHVPSKDELWGYGDLIQKEIQIINPNIIVCAGSETYDFMINHSYMSNGLEKKGDGKNFRYHPKTNTLIVYSGHPGSQNYKGFRYQLDPDLYDGVFSHVRDFLKSNRI